MLIGDVETAYMALVKLSKFKPGSDAARYKIFKNIIALKHEIDAIVATRKSIAEELHIKITPIPNGQNLQAEPLGWNSKEPLKNTPELRQEANDLLNQYFRRSDDFAKTKNEPFEIRQLSYPNEFPTETTSDDMVALYWMITEESLIAFEESLEKKVEPLERK